jgi:hypothetical protein
MIINQRCGANHGDAVDFGDFEVQPVDHPVQGEIVQAIFQRFFKQIIRLGDGAADNDGLRI